MLLDDLDRFVMFGWPVSLQGSPSWRWKILAMSRTQLKNLTELKYVEQGAGWNSAMEVGMEEVGVVEDEMVEDEDGMVEEEGEEGVGVQAGAGLGPETGEDEVLPTGA